MDVDHGLGFGALMKRLRSQLDLTQERLAEQVGCAVQTIRACERESRRPSREMAERLATILQLDTTERTHFLRLARGVGPDRADADHSPAASPPREIARPRLVSPINLIGRAAEQAELLSHLRSPGRRLITLVGAGGIGKTSLALHIAATIAADPQPAFNDGVAVALLAAVVRTDDVPLAIADALGVSIQGARPVTDQLLDVLRERRLLLVLDNLEHLLGASNGEAFSALLGRILAEAPSVRLLATSRERLRIRDEWVLELGGLALPTVDSGPRVDQADAVRLFVERAQRIAPGFSLSGEGRAAVAQICRRLEGMPLAIELAAAWAHVLAPREIADEVERALDFLTRTDRDAPTRHRSMRAALDHSWRLLDDAERHTLARLTVFRGGCQRAAAVAVAGATLPVLVALLDKSLIRRIPGSDDEPRYELHELVRQYAAAQLAADPHEAAATRDQHCAYYADWVNAQQSILQGPQQQRAINDITAEIDNLRAAWQHAVDQRQIELLWIMSEQTVLLWFYELRSWYQELEAMCQRAVEALRTPPPATREEEVLLGSLIGCWGWGTFRCGRPDHGIQLLEESLELLRPGEHPLFLFFTLEQLAYLIFLKGDFERAVALQDQALEIAKQIDNPWVRSHAFFLRAAVFVDRQPEIAYTRFHEGLPHIRAVGDHYHLSLSLGFMGEAALFRGAVQEAEQAFTEALSHSAQVGNQVSEAAALTGLAMVACARGAWGQAIAHSLEALARARESGDMWSRAKALVTLAEAEAGGGDNRAARRNFAEAISIGITAWVLPTAIDAWVGLAKLDAQGGADMALLTILALVRDHTVTRYQTARRAMQLWAALAPQVDRQTLAEIEQQASSIAPDELGRLLSAYVDGHAAAALGHAQPAATAPPQRPAPARGVLISETGSTLSPRELEVLQLLIAGANNQAIADALIISQYTVKHHVASILAKLGVASRTQAALRGRELGLVPPTTDH